MPLLHRHVPVLDPQPTAVDLAVVGADVAGGVDPLDRGLQRLVAEDPALSSSTSRPAFWRASRRASPRRRPRRSRPRRSCRSRSRPPSTSSSPSNAASVSPPWISIPFDSSSSLEAPPRLLAEGPGQRHVLHHHDRAVGPLRRQRRGHLAADVAAADQHHPRRPSRPSSRIAVRVAERAQVVDPVELGALDPEDVDVRAGGDQRLLEVDLVARPGASPSAPRCRATSRWCPLRSSTPFSSYQSGGLT